MKHHTWYDLADHFCARERSLLDGGINSHFEHLAARRYNYASGQKQGSVRAVFLKSAGADPANKTLLRSGRFIWCKQLKYEGKDSQGYRQVSFQIANGKKRFYVSERCMIVIPNNIYINNNSFFRKYNRVFSSFSSVFDYRDAIKIMRRNDTRFWESPDEYGEFLAAESPFVAGTLVRPRKGLFFPKLDTFQQKIAELSTSYCDENFINHRYQELVTYLSGRDYITLNPELQELFDGFQTWCQNEPAAQHPVGIVLGRARNISPHSGRELYRVSFAETIYEEIHPIQLEVINEV
jgi:hypothetical protein